MIARIASAVALVAIAAFCVFGFLATFEPPGSPSLRVAYGVASATCLAGVSGLAVPGVRREPA